MLNHEPGCQGDCAYCQLQVIVRKHDEWNARLLHWGDKAK